MKICFLLTKAAGDNFILSRLISSLPKNWSVIAYVDSRYVDVTNFFQINSFSIGTPARYYGLRKILVIINFFTVTYIKLLIRQINGYRIVLPFGDYYELIIYYMLFKKPIIKKWHKLSRIRYSGIFPRIYSSENFENIYFDFLNFFKKNIYIKSFYVKGLPSNLPDKILVCSKGSQNKKILSEKLIKSIVSKNYNKIIYVDFDLDFNFDAKTGSLIKIKCTLIDYIKLISNVSAVYTVESLAQHVANYYNINCTVYPGGGDPHYFVHPDNYVVYNSEPICYPCFNNNKHCNFDCLINEI